MKKTTDSRHKTIFVVEDDPTYRRLIEYTLSLNPDFEVKPFETGKQCLGNLHLSPSVIVLDYGLPDIDGIDVLKSIKKYNTEIEVIMLSAQKDVDVVVDLLKSGAYDYINKESQSSAELKDRLLNSLVHISKKQALKKEVSTLKEQLSNKFEFSKTLIGQSKALKNVFSLMEKAARTDITVSITGKTGTGKEVAAKAIHYNSRRKRGPFVAVNVTAIPSELLESELFGHEKGAFTGAITRRIGRFEEANKGTLFLDEISEMDINLQAKLLRVLQERELTRVGGNDLIKIDARIIVATHRNLQEQIANGKFRQDLYYRLLGLPIEMPPLKDRGKDVLLLARHFLKEFCKQNGFDIPDITPTAQEKLLKYGYPGNIRELKAVIELAAVMSSGPVIDTEHIRFDSNLSLNNLLNEERSLKEYTKHIILYFLEKYNYNVVFVAEKLQIGKSTIYRMLKEWEAEDEVFN